MESNSQTSIYITHWIHERKAEELGRGVRRPIGATGLCVIVEESEKAYRVKCEFCTLTGDDFTRKIWVPKSQTMTAEEYEAECQARAQKFQTAADRYEALVAAAKAAGVKGVRKGMKRDTIIQKMAEAGVDITGWN